MIIIINIFYMARFFKKRDESLWKAPGSLIFIGTKKMEQPSMELIHYNSETIKKIEDAKFNDLSECFNKDNISWLNINGIHDSSLIQEVGDYFNFHVLMQEDILNSSQRPKFEEYDNCIFLVLKMLKYDSEQQQIQTEQLSIVVFENYVISFQEEIVGDVFDSIRERLNRPSTKIRNAKGDYLAYAMMDAIVDNYIFIVEQYGEQIEALEKKLIKQPNHSIVEDINHYKVELNYLRKTIRPVRELIVQYTKSESALIDNRTLPYLKDLLDHITHTSEAIETYQDMLKDQLETYQTNVSIRLSDIIRVLTIFSVIFIPITFFAGVYGTNFEYFPELTYRYAYPVFWGIIILVVIVMLVYFKHKKWI